MSADALNALQAITSGSVAVHLVLSLVFFFMARVGEGPLRLFRVWGLVFVVFGAILAFPALVASTRGTLLLHAAEMTLFAGGVVIVAHGTARTMGASLPRATIPAAGTALAASVAVEAAGGPHWIATAVLCWPMALGEAAVGVWALRRSAGSGQRFLGLGLVLAAIHQADYPLIGRIPAAMPWGVTIASTLAVVLAVGAIMATFEASSRALREAQAALVAARRVETAGHVTNAMMHDMDNLLAGVRATSESMLGGGLRAEQSEAIQVILDAADRAAALVGRLQSLARDQPADRDAADLRELVRRDLPLLRSAAGPSIDVGLDAGLHELGVCVDAGEIGQILLNLVLNARDACAPRGTVRIALRRDGPWALLEVSDSGTGMTAETRSRLFEPFFTTKGERGLGLGLLSVRRIVDELQGTIDVESEPGAGATFVIRIPLLASSVPLARSA